MNPKAQATSFHPEPPILGLIAQLESLPKDDEGLVQLPAPSDEQIFEGLVGGLLWSSLTRYRDGFEQGEI